MDYFGIVKRSFFITIKNKYLWLFGFFVGASGGSYNFYSGGGNPGNTNYNKKTNYSWDNFISDARNFLVDHWTIILVIGILIFGIAIFFLIMRVISQGALVHSVNEIDDGQESSIKAGFKVGKKYFWRIFGLGLLTSLVILAAMGVLGVPIIFLFVYKMYLRAVILTLLALVIFIPLSIIVNYIVVYGYRYIVLQDKKIRDAVRMSFDLFIKNIWQSIVLSLILFLVGIIAMIATMVALFALAIPFILLGFLAFFLANWIGAGIVIGLAILVVIVLMVLWGAIMATFQSSLWTLAFKELLKR